MADNTLPKVAENALPVAAMENVTHVRVVSTDNSERLPINNLTIAGTKVTVAVDGLSGTVDGAFGDVLTAIAEKADTTQVEALDDADKANYAKAVEMIAHDATAPSPVIPTGTTKTYEFSSGGLCSWITGGAVTVEKGDKVTVTFTAPITWTRIYVKKADIDTKHLLCTDTSGNNIFDKTYVRNDKVQIQRGGDNAIIATPFNIVLTRFYKVPSECKWIEYSGITSGDGIMARFSLSPIDTGTAVTVSTGASGIIVITPTLKNYPYICLEVYRNSDMQAIPDVSNVSIKCITDAQQHTIANTLCDINGDPVKFSDMTNANGAYIYAPNGLIKGGNAAYGTTPFIYIKGVTSIKYKGNIVDSQKTIVAYCAFYDKYKNFISSLTTISGGDIIKDIATIPTNAVWVRFCSSSYSTIFEASTDSLFQDNFNVIESKKRYDDGRPKNIIGTKESAGMSSVIHDWGFIGDSLSSGVIWFPVGAGKDAVTDYKYSWGQRLISRIGQAKGTNFSIGGHTTKTWIDRYATDLNSGYTIDGSNSFFTEDKKQAYVIALGVNDIGTSVPIGNFSTDVDLNNYANNANTFCGNYAGIIQRIKAIQPSAKIFVCTLPDIFIGGAEGGGWNTIIRSMAVNFTNVYVIDLFYALLSLPQYYIDNLIYKYSGHLTAVGYQWLTDNIQSLIDDVISNNISSFKYVNMIGTTFDTGQF